MEKSPKSRTGWWMVGQATLVAGWTCLSLGAILFAISGGWAVVFWVPLFIGAMILGIISLILKRVRGGSVLLFATVLIPILLILITDRYGDM